MNKTVIFVVIATLAFLALVGVGLLQFFRPDASATFIGYSLTLLSLIVSAAGTIYMLGKQAEQLKDIQGNVNGNLNRAHNEKAALEAQLLAAGLVPVTTAKVGEPTTAPAVPEADTVVA